jgi:hypothetical protein
MNPIQVVHDETTITYNESEDKWEFTLRGRDRSAESLAKAKEYIDKPVPAEKAKPFEKIPAWFLRYERKPVQIEVTGIAERPRYGGDNQVWIKSGTHRSKENVRDIVPSNPKNDALIVSMLENLEARSKLVSEYEKLRQKLEPLVIAKETE